MNDIAVLGLQIILLFFIWKKTLRKALLDHYHDKLFDLRDTARDVFLRRTPLGLSDPAYRFLRNQINDSIRFLRRGTLSRSLILHRLLASRPALVRAIRQDLDERYFSETPGISGFCNFARGKMNQIIREFIFRRSLLGNLLSLLRFTFKKASRRHGQGDDYDGRIILLTPDEIGVIRRVSDRKMQFAQERNGHVMAA